jgi:excisionase family DNA binding protein
MTDILLNVNQAAAQLQVSVRRVRKLCEQGRLPATKLGWSWIIRSADVEAYVRHKAGSAE